MGEGCVDGIMGDTAKCISEIQPRDEGIFLVSLAV